MIVVPETRTQQPTRGNNDKELLQIRPTEY